VVAAASQETAVNSQEQPLDAFKQLPQENVDHRVAIETHSFSLAGQGSSESEEKNTAYSVNEVLTHKSISTTLNAFGKPNKKLTKAERAAQVMEQERQERLRHIGQELRQARLQRSLTLRQLHSRTLVPLHQIEALETGRVEELPEDVYLRGFIRRIGHALSLDGIALAASLPNPDPVKSVVPSWYHSNSAKAFLPGGYNLTPVHLYFGYAALVAGAVGGLACMSQKSSAGEPIELDPTLSHPPSVSPSNRDAEPVGKPGLQSTKAGVKAGSDIAPPEAF
jgi:cytoskeleton protein RodZ